MQKKHGIIVGISLLFIALVITFIASQLQGKDAPKKDVPTTNKTQTNTTKEPQKQEDKKDVTTVLPQQNTTVPQNTTQDIQTNNVSILEIAQDTIKNPDSVLNEIMLVSNKKIMLIDLDTTSNENKQMVYVIDMLSSNGKTLSLYVNGVVYEDINVGDTLNIEYNKYVNSKGVEIPIIIEAKKTTT